LSPFKANKFEGGAVVPHADEPFIPPTVPAFLFERNKTMIFFALIGLIVFVWFVSRVLIIVGTLLENAGDRIAMQGIYRTPGRQFDFKENKRLHDNLKEVKQQNTEYQKRIQKEIDELTN
jgi:hypothetical protein